MNRKQLKATIALVALAAIFAVAATAKTTSLKLYLPADVELGGKVVAQGEYRVEIQNDQSSNPTVIFYTGKREVARIQGTWIDLPSPAAYDSVVTGKNDAGKMTLTKILLKQNKKAISFK